MRMAVYAGSFDPMTNGHLDVLSNVCNLFDQVIVAVLENPDKKPMFHVEERKQMMREATDAFGNVVVDSFSGLLVDYVKLKGAHAIIRGLRDVGDFENEMKMAQMNRHLYHDAVTLFVPTSPESSFISSSLVKQVAHYGGKIDGLVPAVVAKAIHNRARDSGA